MKLAKILQAIGLAGIMGCIASILVLTIMEHPTKETTELPALLGVISGYGGMIIGAIGTVRQVRINKKQEQDDAIVATIGSGE